MTNYEEILNRFLEESKFDSNPNILSIVVYGSRVSSINKETSDLDILAITNQANNFKNKSFFIIRATICNFLCRLT